MPRISAVMTGMTEAGPISQDNGITGIIDENFQGPEPLG